MSNVSNSKMCCETLCFRSTGTLEILCFEIRVMQITFVCFRLCIMSNSDRLKAMGQCLETQRTAEEIRAETERIRLEVERKKKELARLQRENLIYERNAWKLEADVNVEKDAGNVQ